MAGAAGEGVPKKLNIILDIDETIIQYVDTGSWDLLSQIERDKYEFVPDPENEDRVFILRPHFDTFFKELKKISETINLWTWSPKGHAEKMAAIIKKRTGVNIVYKWGEETAAAAENEYGGNKNLEYIWKELGEFDPSNTVLIDELPKNTQNKENTNNGILLKEFAPLKERHTDQSCDDTLPKVLGVLRAIRIETGKRPFEGSTKVLGGRRRKTRKGRKVRKTKTRR